MFLFANTNLDPSKMGGDRHLGFITSSIFMFLLQIGGMMIRGFILYLFYPRLEKKMVFCSGKFFFCIISAINGPGRVSSRGKRDAIQQSLRINKILLLLQILIMEHFEVFSFSIEFY